MSARVINVFGNVKLVTLSNAVRGEMSWIIHPILVTLSNLQSNHTWDINISGAIIRTADAIASYPDSCIVWIWLSRETRAWWSRGIHGLLSA
jgi:hypothetical protein